MLTLMQKLSSNYSSSLVAVALFMAAALVGGVGVAVFGGVLIGGTMPAMIVVDVIAVALVVAGGVFLGLQLRRNRTTTQHDAAE
jgi:hypothetical protein